MYAALALAIEPSLRSMERIWQELGKVIVMYLCGDLQYQNFWMVWRLLQDLLTMRRRFEVERSREKCVGVWYGVRSETRNRRLSVG